MFAYGKTVQWVHSKGLCELNAAEQDPHHTRGQTAELVTALIAKEPTSRPSALEPIEQIFFSVLRAVNREGHENAHYFVVPTESSSTAGLNASAKILHLLSAWKLELSIQ